MSNKHKVIFKKGEPKEIYNLLVNLQKAFEVAESEILKSFPQVDQLKDSRFLVFSLSKETVQCYILSAVFFKDSLAEPVWWKKQKTISTDITKENIVDILSKYQEELKTGFINSIFIHLEIFVRTVTNALPDNGSKKPNETINQIKDYLIDRTLVNLDYKNLVSIIRHIRNSFHLGGFHTSRPEQISYKRFDLKLEKAKPIAAGDWTDLNFLIEELIEFYLSVSKSEVVKNILFIEHPHSTIEQI